MNDDGCYVQLYFYDTLSSLSLGTRPCSIRHETCMILRGNLPLLLPTVTGTPPTVPGTRPNVTGTRPTIAGTHPIVACTQMLCAAALL
jgi:hypothetical protein